MDYDLLSLILFYFLALLFFLVYKKRFTIQGKILALYKTKIGLVWMGRFAESYPNLLRYVGYVSLALGYAGMIFISFFLIKETLKFLTIPGTPPPLAPILPGIQIPGAPKLSFWHWIISIFFVAVVHEFSHGVFARLNKIKIKSSGFAFLGPILLAFVDPDEKLLRKKNPIRQSIIFSAGPFANLLFGLIFFLLLSYLIAPIIMAMVVPVNGVLVADVTNSYPAQQSGLIAPFIISEVNNVKVSNLTSFLLVMEDVKPGNKISLLTDKGTYELLAAANPENKTKAFLGLAQLTDHDVKEGFNFIFKVLLWFNLLFIWLFIINLGVGLFNLLPFGPADGGRMFYILLFAIFKDENKAKRYWGAVTIFCLLLILINLWPWILKLLIFLSKPLLFILSLII